MCDIVITTTRAGDEVADEFDGQEVVVVHQTRYSRVHGELGAVCEAVWA
jgi:hypothetical protein